MLHTIFSIILGLAMVGVLSAILEILALKNHQYLSRILAAICVLITAYSHTWIRLLIIMGVAVLFLMVRRDLERRAERKAQGITHV